MKQRGFFDEEDRLKEISRLGDPLERLNATIEWERFRPYLNRILKKDAKGPGGRPPFDFERFNQWLEEAGLITRTGSIVDATFVDVPRQRNSKDENEAIKNGTIPEEWQTQENRHKMAQKDVDALWTKKHDETHYGYKNHIKADKDSKLIVRYAVTSVEVHDSHVVQDLVEKDKDQVLYADSAYKGKEIEHCLGDEIENKICEKGYRNKPLTERQKRQNTKKSKIRARIEHIFGFMTTSMKGMMIRCIGRARAAFTIGRMNLVYNMCRYEFLMRARS